jgi:hypothetical protein
MQEPAGSVDAGDKALAAERPPDALGPAQLVEQLILILGNGRQKRGDARRDVLCWRARHAAVVIVILRCARARPRPVLRARDQPRAHGL